EIAHRGETKPLHDRPFGLADEFVKVAGPKATRDLQTHLAERSAHSLLDGNDLLAFDRPLAARDDDALVGFARPPGQHALFLALLRRRIAAVIRAARQGHALHFLVAAHLVAHGAGDRFVLVARDRRFEQHAPAAGQQFADPAAPHHGVAAAEQKAVAGVGLRFGIVAGRAVEEAQRELVAAV